MEISLKGVSESRNIPIAKLNEYADSVITFANPNQLSEDEN